MDLTIYKCFILWSSQLQDVKLESSLLNMSKQIFVYSSQENTVAAQNNSNIYIDQ